MAISSRLTPGSDHARLAETRDRQQDESHRIAVEQAERARAHRKAHWDAKEAEWAAARRRSAGLTFEDHRRVQHFIEFAQHVDRLRVAGRIPEAVKAWERMSDRVNELDPPDASGTHRLWAHASNELRTRYRFAYPESRLVKEGFSEFCSDCAGGFYREHESAPAEQAPSEQAPGEGERVDASGPSSGERADGDCVRIELSR